MKRIFSELTLVFALVCIGAQSVYSQSKGQQRDPRLEAAIRSLRKAQTSESQPADQHPIEEHVTRGASATTTTTVIGGGLGNIGQENEATTAPSAENQNRPYTLSNIPYAHTEDYLSLYDTLSHRSLWTEEINLAVILPFNLDARTADDERKQSRSVEFYQGLLLAVDRFQRIGQRISVQAYDLGTRTLADILADSALLRAHAIVAPMDTFQVADVASFGEANDIPVISPFNYSQALVDSFPHLFQLVAPQSSLFDQLGEELLSQFRNFRFVFVADSLCQTQVDPCPAYLKTMLADREIPYDEYIYNEPQSVISMDSALELYDKHVLYILETPQKTALQRFFPNLKNKLFLDANPAVAEALGAASLIGSNYVTVEELVPDSLYSDSVQLITEDRKVAVLGYPSWQLYLNDFMDSFYDLNVWMFSKFYANPFEDEVQEFYNDFRFWFNREVQALYPKFGLLGYDVATYTLTKLQLFGTLHGDIMGEAPIATLQTPIHFERQGTGCFVNRGFYLVHFAPDATIEKVEIH